MLKLNWGEQDEETEFKEYPTKHDVQIDGDPFSQVAHGNLQLSEHPNVLLSIYPELHYLQIDLAFTITQVIQFEGQAIQVLLWFDVNWVPNPTPHPKQIVGKVPEHWAHPVKQGVHPLVAFNPKPYWQERHVVLLEQVLQNWGQLPEQTPLFKGVPNGQLVQKLVFEAEQVLHELEQAEQLILEDIQTDPGLQEVQLDEFPFWHVLQEAEHT